MHAALRHNTIPCIDGHLPYYDDLHRMESAMKDCCPGTCGFSSLTFLFHCSLFREKASALVSYFLTWSSTLSHLYTPSLVDIQEVQEGSTLS